MQVEASDPITDTILVVEDSPVVQHLIRASLASLDLPVLTAADGGSGLELARRHLPSVVLLDIGLPVLDGWQVLAALRADPRTAHLRVVVVTAHAQPEVVEEAETQGADGFLTKPFRPQDLRDLVIAQLAGRPAAWSAARPA